MKSLYFDVVSGASGDMILSSLIDLGVPLEYLREQFAKLHIPGFSIDVVKQKRSGISANHLVLNWETPRTYRHVDQILDMIRSANFGERVFAHCEKVIMAIGKAEAKVHDMPLEKVHFHEIGAIDTIVDVSGICLALEYLDIDEIQYSTLTDGKGSVKTDHGMMPVPVPAVAEMLHGVAMNILDVQSELLTPTGCAVLTALGNQKPAGFFGTVQKTGYGCGTRILEKIPNVLRVFLLEQSNKPATDTVCLLESDMDHISGEIMGDVASRLLASGALDVSWSSIYMKKGRPGYRLFVICDLSKQQELTDVIMVHSRTLGVRFQTVSRVVAERQSSQTLLLGEQINRKKCTYGGHSFTKPEYESLAMLSRKRGIPILEILEQYYKET